MDSKKFPPEPPEVLLQILERVEMMLVNGSNQARDYFPGQTESNFYGDSRLVLKHKSENDRSESYDLRLADDVANLRFYEAPDVDLRHEFDYDDRFVLSYRESYGESDKFVYRIVFGIDGSVRLHKRYIDMHGQRDISDCSAAEAYDILTGIFEKSSVLEPSNLLESPDPQIRALGMDVYFRSLQLHFE